MPHPVTSRSCFLQHLEGYLLLIQVPTNASVLAGVEDIMGHFDIAMDLGALECGCCAQQYIHHLSFVAGVASIMGHLAITVQKLVCV